MLWHLLPPRTPEECRFRSQPEDGTGGEVATCALVRNALPDADAGSGRVSRSTCVACCQAAPANRATWNPVVGSLIFHAASARLSDPSTSPTARAQAVTARARAFACLDVGDPAGASEEHLLPPTHSLRELLPPPNGRRPEPIRQWAVGVTTAPRPRSTLEVCLDHLGRAGWNSPHLFLDSAVRVPDRFGHLPGTLRSPAVGAWPNHYLALLELTLRQPDADAFLLVQDDALLYDGANVRTYLEETLWPSGLLPVVSLYCPAPYTARRCGWHLFRGQWLWGALALVFPRPIAQQYLRDRSICEHRWQSATGGLAQIDALLGWWARRQRIPFWYPTPSLVQHIGETSTLSEESMATGARRASAFVGHRVSGQPPFLRE